VSKGLEKNIWFGEDEMFWRMEVEMKGSLAIYDVELIRMRDQGHSSMLKV
jgi:hypothetical protein